jgi:hypothetical protein
VGGPKIVHAACWAHARRKFFQAVELNPVDRTAIGIVAQLDELFEIDAQARKQGLSQEDRQLLRLEKSKPLLEQIKSQIQAARTSALPKSVLAKACNYTLTLWTRLTRFVEHSELELSNNGLDAPCRAWTPQLDTHRKRGGWTARCSHRLDRRNLPTTKNPDSRLSLLDLAGLGGFPDQTNR